MEYDTGVAVESYFSIFQSALEYVFELAETQRIVLATVLIIEKAHRLNYNKNVEI